ncbi:MAG: GNAT family N-acetyltransferase [Dermatophilaceae bacterium]
MDITEVRPDDSALVDAVAGLSAEADAVDCPWRIGLTTRSLRALLTHGWDGEPSRCYAGALGGQVVAAAELWLPLRDNLRNAWFTGTVHPRLRRRGFGSELYDHLEAVALGEGRSVLGTHLVDHEAARGFAARRGYQLKYVGAYRRMAVSAVPADVVDTAYAEARAAAGDYDIVRLAGPLTDEQITECLPVVASINDAPTDDLVIEDEVFTADRVRAYDEAQRERGARMYRVWARHRDTGEVAGHTVVAVEGERPWLGEQHDTTVLPKHRGHRLGLLLKADMVRWLRDLEPDLATILTDNAESNAHMIAVNERLGYQVVGRGLEFQRDAS